MEFGVCITVRLNDDVAVYATEMAAIIVGLRWVEEVQGFQIWLLRVELRQVGQTGEICCSS